MVAAGYHNSPVPYAEFVTGTTQKTLRGPRGGFILCKRDYRKKIDNAVFPGIQGGPLMHVIAAKAVCFKQAMSDEFKEYIRQVIKNAKALAEELAILGYRIVTGGTDNHLVLVDLRPKNITGKEAEETLEKVNIVANKNLIPFDDKKPTIASGIRFGTPCITTRGLKEDDVREVARLIDEALENRKDPAKLQKIKERVLEICKAHPLYWY